MGHITFRKDVSLSSTFQPFLATYNKSSFEKPLKNFHTRGRLYQGCPKYVDDGGGLKCARFVKFQNGAYINVETVSQKIWTAARYRPPDLKIVYSPHQ